ncbi:hypothetical protein JYK22_32905, partial [Nonomuraea sp. RK-328]|nr:hypothetical protein [Nonomuraea sp. RK-328]
MLEQAHDHEEIIQRVAALDIGKAGLTCCIGCPTRPGPANDCRRVAGLPAVRRWLVGLLWRAHVIRRWDRAARFAGLATHNDRVPRVMEAVETGARERLLVRVPKGGAACDIEDRAPWLAASLEAAQVLVHADDVNARYAHVEVIRRDPLDGFGVLGWPWTDAPDHGWVADAWEPIPVGVSETGELVTVSLLSDGPVRHQGRRRPEHHLSGPGPRVSPMDGARRGDQACRRR